LVVPKGDTIADLFTPDEASALAMQGGASVDWAAHEPGRARILLTAVGAYQLHEVLVASRRLAERDVAHRVIYLVEPGRFRCPRSAGEQRHRASAALVEQLFPSAVLPRLFVTHTRPEAILGLLGPLHTGATTAALGYVNRGGTLTTPGMLFVNRCTWAHVLAEAARVLDVPREELLTSLELQALDGLASPHGVIVPHIPGEVPASWNTQ
jgi:phosphoketolase